MGLKILDIPAYTEASSTEALVSYTLCTPLEPEMIVLAAWRGPGFRMAVGVTGRSASVHHSSVMSHHPNMEGAKGRPSFIRESAVWLEGPKTQLFLCSFFTTLLSNSPTFSMGSHHAGEDSKLAPHLHTLLPCCQVIGPLSKHTSMHLQTHNSRLVLLWESPCANQECNFLMLFSNYLLLICEMPTCENPVEREVFV